MRNLGVLVATVVLAAGCSTTPGRDEIDPTAAPSPTQTTVARSERPPTTPTPDPTVRARRLLTDVAAAAMAEPDELRAAVATAMGGDLAGLVAKDWENRVLEGLPRWPVLVGEATVGADGTVDLDVALDAPPDADGDLVLRWLPAAPALGEAVEDVAVTVDGQPVDVTVDAAGARLQVPVAPGTGHVVRVAARYRVPDRDAITDDGSPASYGLLARTDEAVMLGHWLPLVALPSDDGPMQARGDVGAFPPAAFSVVMRHEGALVSGGEERACPAPADGCTWLQGIGLRDLAAVVVADPIHARRDGVAVHLPVGSPAVDRAQEVADEAAEARAVLASELGDLPWPNVDVVAAPISPGAAGMEFPGLVWVDTEAWPQPGADFGSYVLAHELGHQWFHALVGNGSLSAPVVDESLAQYLSVVAFDALFGPGDGAGLAARALGGRHADAMAAGVPDESPAQPLAAFSSARSYGANVYGRGGQAWVDAEVAAGREEVMQALRVLVQRFGLQEVDPPVVLDVVREVAPDAADALAQGWGLAATP